MQQHRRRLLGTRSTSFPRIGISVPASPTADIEAPRWSTVASESCSSIAGGCWAHHGKHTIEAVAAYGDSSPASPTTDIKARWVYFLLTVLA
jgi:hypothetical protein